MSDDRQLSLLDDDDREREPDEQDESWEAWWAAIPKIPPGRSGPDERKAA